MRLVAPQPRRRGLLSLSSATGGQLSTIRPLRAWSSTKMQHVAQFALLCNYRSAARGVAQCLSTSHSVDIGLGSAEVAQILSILGQTWPQLAEFWPELSELRRRVQPKFGRCRPKLPQMWPMSGTDRPKSGQLRRTHCEIWPVSAKNMVAAQPTSAESGPHSIESRPKFADEGRLRAIFGSIWSRVRPHAA